MVRKVLQNDSPDRGQSRNEEGNLRISKTFVRAPSIVTRQSVNAGEPANMLRLLLLAPLALFAPASACKPAKRYAQSATQAEARSKW